MKQKHLAFNLARIRQLYPFQSHYLTLKHRTGESFRSSVFHFVDEGEGSPVLFLHGNPTWSFYFRNMILGLRERQRCLALDHLGCGLSDRPEGVIYRLEDRARLIEVFLDALKIDKVSLVVHDWGGAIGCKFAVDHPERVDKLVITNTAAFPSDWISWRINLCRQPVIGRCINKYFNGFLGAALRMAVVNPLSGAEKSGYLLPYRRIRDRDAIHQFVRDIPMDPKHPTYATLASIREGFSRLADHPACLLWGMRDFCFTPYFLGKWKEILPHAESHEYADAGHFLFDDAGQECLEVLRRFLQASSPSD